MNINATELLLLNKKIKFGEAGGNNDVKEGSNPNVILPSPEENKPQTGMNALMFQGLNNVVSNPDLSTATGTNLSFLRETAPEQTAENAEKEYVAPYKSNIAFQGGKFKSLALGAMMALAALGGTASLTSCSPEEPANISQTVSVDMTALIEIWQQMFELMKEQNEQNQEMNEQLNQMNQNYQYNNGQLPNYGYWNWR